MQMYFWTLFPGFSPTHPRVGKNPGNEVGISGHHFSIASLHFLGGEKYMSALAGYDWCILNLRVNM